MYANMFVIIDIRIEHIWSKRKRKRNRKREEERAKRKN
jgi:hypothetical protein